MLIPTGMVPPPKQDEQASNVGLFASPWDLMLWVTKDSCGPRYDLLLKRVCGFIDCHSLNTYIQVLCTDNCDNVIPNELRPVERARTRMPLISTYLRPQLYYIFF